MKKCIVFLLAVGLISVSHAGVIVSTTFNSAMNAADSTNFDIVRSPDTLVAFGYNWSNLSTGDTTSGYYTVPASPRGDLTGLRLEANNGDANGFDEGVTVYPKVTPSAKNYDFMVDIYGSYTLPVNGGGAGSTWHTGIVLFSSGTCVNTLTDTDLNTMDPVYSPSPDTAQDGLSFGYDPDSGDGLSTFWCFMPTSRSTTAGFSQSNGQVGTWTGATSVPVGTGTGKFLTDPVYFSAMNYPMGRMTTGFALTPGYVWNTLKASVRNNVVSFYINNVMYCSVVSSLTTKRLGILLTDPYSSIANPASQEYVLVDNPTVIEYTITTDVNKSNWMLFR